MGLGGLAGFGGFGIRFIEDLLNIGEARRGEGRNEALARESGGGMDEALGRARTNASAYTDPNWLFNQSGYGKDPASGDYVDPRTFFREDRTAGAKYGDMLAGLDLDPTSTAGKVGGFYDPTGAADTSGDFFRPAEESDWMANRLSQIGGASRARQSTNRQDLLTRGLASGAGLEGLGGALQGLDYSEAIARGGEATTASATAEAARNAARLAKATEQSRIFGDITAREGDAMSTMFREATGLGAEAAKNAGLFEAGDIAASDARKQELYKKFQDAWEASRSSGLNAQAVNLGLSQQDLAGAVQKGNWLTGAGSIIPQYSAGSDFMDNWTQMEVARINAAAQEDEMSGFLGVPGFGGVSF